MNEINAPLLFETVLLACVKTIILHLTIVARHVGVMMRSINE